MGAFTLFEDYCRELNKYGAEFERQHVVTQCLEYRRIGNWIPIKISGKEVGFIIIIPGRYYSTELDYFIEQVYIAPEYRRRGIMKLNLDEMFKAAPGRYGLFILDKNYMAKGFWHKVQENSYLRPIKISKDPEAENCSFYAFETT